MRWIILVTLLSLSPACADSQSPQLVPDTLRMLRDDRDAGRKAYSIQSAILNETRRIDVALPTSFATSSPRRRYPVVVVLDGEASFSAAASIADELSRNGQVPEAIVVAIENTNRLRDLTPPGLSVSGSSRNEGGDRFLDFVEKELLPEVERQFRGAAPLTLVGHSSGGILATYAAATRSIYCCILALDTPTHLGENWLPARLMERARRGTSPLRYASYEARFGWNDAAWKALVEAAPRNWTLHREPLARENHESMPFLGMYLGMRELFADYSMMSAPVSPTTSTLSHYANVGKSLGAAVPPPKRLLLGVVEDLLMEGRGKAANDAYAMLVEAFGAPANAGELVAQIAEVSQSPPPTETVEDLLATPFPSPAEAGPWIGEWSGDVWMNPDELSQGRPKSVLRIAVTNGKVTGETVTSLPGGETLIQKWTYFRITPTGMTFGYMNGMRPRGMLMHDGVFKDGVLSGVMRFGGINFKRPPEFGNNEIHFRYTKVKR